MGNIQEKSKRLFANTIKQMLEAEIGEHLDDESTPYASYGLHGETASL